MRDDSDSNALSGYDSSQIEMMEELCILVDSKDNVIGSASKVDCHRGKGLLHRAFSVLILDDKNRLLIQKRAAGKITFPNVWANTCCSHPLDITSENGDPIEGVTNAAIRKLEQELGIPTEESSSWEYNYLGKFEYSCRWDSEWIEHEIDHVLLVNANTNPIPNLNEISEVMWLDQSELEEMMSGSGKWEHELVAPWFKIIWQHFISPHYPNMKLLYQSRHNEIINYGLMNLIDESNDPGENLLNALSNHREIVENEIMNSLGKIEQTRLHGAMTHLFTGGGKRLRAILPRLVGEAVGNANNGHYTLGACIEIIHNFTLVHDDIMDQDPIRRGLPAVHIAYDDPTAINAGDAMLAVGFEILADSEYISSQHLRCLVQSIGEMVRRVAEGQQEDFEFENRDRVSEEEYVSMIAGKTSAMFETCAKTGAILAGVDDQIVQNMAEWGLKLGLCFQLMDDLIDITGDTETIGKPAGSDIIQGKRTLVAIHALKYSENLTTFNKIYGTGKSTPEELERAVLELQDNGSIQYALDRAMLYHKQAHQMLDTLPDSPAVDILRELTDFQLIRIN